MSDIVTTFNPATAAQTSFTAPQSAANGALVFWNESNNSIELSFGDGSTLYLPAWYHRHKCGATGTVKVEWSIHATLTSNAPPVSEVIVEAYHQTENFPADGPLVRQTNIGNPVTTMTQGSTLVNTGNALNTSNVIQVAPVGDVGFTTTLDNMGNLVIGDATHPGSVSFDNAQVTTDGFGDMTAAEFVHDKNTVNNSTTGSGFYGQDSTGTKHLIIHCLSIDNDTHVLTGPGGHFKVTSNTYATDYATFDSTGLTLNGGSKLWFNDGSRVASFHHFGGTGNGTVATGCTGTPGGIMFDPCTQSGSSQTIGGTRAQSSVVTTGAGLAWDGTAYTV